MNQIKDCPKCGRSELSPLHIVDCTPASLDPSKVKAGDTVTVDIVARADGGDEAFSITGTAYTMGSTVLVGGWPITDHPRVTLTDHQPTPEPGPEWEPGDMAAVTARGWVNGWSVRTAANDGWASHSESDDVRRDAEVESVRPLSVIDPTPALRADIEAAGRRLVAAHAMQPRDENVEIFVAQVYGVLGIEAL